MNVFWGGGGDLESPTVIALRTEKSQFTAAGNYSGVTKNGKIARRLATGKEEILNYLHPSYHEPERRISQSSLRNMVEN